MSSGRAELRGGLLALGLSLLLLTALLSLKWRGAERAPLPRAPREASLSVDWSRYDTLEVTRPGWPSFTLQRDGGWRQDGRALERTLELRLTQALSGLKVLERRATHGAQGLRALGLGERAIQLTFSGAGLKTLTLQLGVERERRATWVLERAQLSAAPPWRALLIEGRLRELFERPAHRWRSHQLTALSPQSLTRLSLRSPQGSWELKRGEGSPRGWRLWSDGRPLKVPLEPSHLRVLLYTLSTLSVTQWLPHDSLTDERELYSFELEGAQGLTRVGVGRAGEALILRGPQGSGYAASYLIEHLSPRWERLIDRALLPVSRGDRRALLIQRGARSVSYVKSGLGWRAQPSHEGGSVQAPLISNSSLIDLTDLSELMRVLSAQGVAVASLKLEGGQARVLGSLTVQAAQFSACPQADQRGALCALTLTITEAPNKLIYLTRSWDDLQLQISAAQAHVLLSASTYASSSP